MPEEGTYEFRERQAAERAERPAQAVILHDIFGDPFHPIMIDPAWLTPEVVKLARDMYESGPSRASPVLGDALEGAGCDNARILAHCRSQTEHARGCWVVDAILGKS